MSKLSGQILERWQFNVTLDPQSNQPNQSDKKETQTNAEIAAIMRQITASVSFLPLLSDPCTFNILVYTNKDADVPSTWVDSDPKMIDHHAQQLKLRSFSTAMHHVDGLVAYRLSPEE